MISNVVLALCLLGAVMILIAALGSLKFPDTLTRMAAVCKASTLGSLLFCLAALIHFQNWRGGVLLTAAAISLALGIPITSHLLSRVRVHDKSPLVTTRNDLQNDLRPDPKD